MGQNYTNVPMTLEYALQTLLTKTQIKALALFCPNTSGHDFLVNPLSTIQNAQTFRELSRGIALTRMAYSAQIRGYASEQRYLPTSAK